MSKKQQIIGLKWRKIVRYRLNKIRSNISISFRSLYGQNELKSDYFVAFLSEIQNVLKINTSPHCAMSKYDKKMPNCWDWGTVLETNVKCNS